MIEPLFPTHRARFRWRRQFWPALPPREQHRLLLFFAGRELNSAAGAVRNHWRRRRRDAAEYFLRRGAGVPDSFRERVLLDRTLREFRTAFAKQSKLVAA